VSEFSELFCVDFTNAVVDIFIRNESSLCWIPRNCEWSQRLSQKGPVRTAFFFNVAVQTWVLCCNIITTLLYKGLSLGQPIFYLKT